MTEEKNEFKIDYKGLYDYVTQENHKLMDDSKKLEEKVREQDALIEELEDAVEERNAEINSLRAEFNTLREQNARLFGEVCGLKFGMRVREAFTARLPKEEIDEYEY